MAIEFDIGNSPKKKAVFPPAVKHYRWMPKEDITTYELALALPVLLYGLRCPFSMGKLVGDLPEEVKRHFEEAE